MFRILTVGLPENLTTWLKTRLDDVLLTTTNSGDEALRILARGGYAMLIIDHHGIDHSPEGLLAQVRTELMLEALPVLYCLEQGLGTTLSGKLLGQLGVKQLLFHPLDREALAHQVALTLGLSLLPPRGQDAHATAEAKPTEQAQRPPMRSVLLIERLPDPFHDALGAALADLGVRLVMSPNLQAAQRRLATDAPAMVLLDAAWLAEEDRAPLISLLSEAKAPVLLLGDDTSLAARLEAARLGAQGLFEKHLPLTPLLEAVQEVLTEPVKTSATVVMLGGPEALSSTLTADFAEAGCAIQRFGEAETFWAALESRVPELVILEAEGPDGTSGIALCQVLRSMPRFRALPILMLVDRADAGARRALSLAGADGYIERARVETDLVPAVVHHLDIKRRLARLPDRDPASGLANRKSALETLQRYFHLAKRHAQPLMVAMLDFGARVAPHAEGDPRPSDALLARVGELVARGVRAEDVVARWAGTRFVIGMYGMSRKNALKKLTRLLEQLEKLAIGPAEGPVTPRPHIAMALFPENGASVQALCSAAEQALNQAIVGDRRQVQVAGWSSAKQIPQVLDVAVVEDDESLSALLQKVLETQGYQSQAFADGEAALKALGGPKPTVSASLILLDLNLPGQDGLSVLRQLAQDGVLAESRVLVMSAYSTDDAVHAALELGAFDYVTKPFNVGTLLQRVQRALNRPPAPLKPR
ncbi:response regulator [bacterium]|nr:response regulator [bacterium]